jgi:outer membrane receptor protein involved in Fe transport
MKNRNLFFALFLAIPLFTNADAPDVVEDTSDVVEQEEEVVVADEEVQTSSQIPSAINDDDVEEVVVTGSRIKKSTFTSIAPLQIISTEISRETGLINAADILQESPSASGVQADLSFAGFNLDNGPGSSTLSLRGLGAGRTLVLINGRRVGPAGVEGAPYAPDLNLLPNALIQRYELLLDGASSVYGSDAIAGVSNAILRKDFDGFELEVFANDSPYSDPLFEDYNVSLSYGINFDRGFIGMAYETDYNQEVQYVDRPWTADCTTDYEITTEGEIRTQNVSYNANDGDYVLDCQYSFTVGKVATYMSLGPWTMGYQEGFDIGGTLGVDLGPNAAPWFPISMGNAIDVDVSPRDGVSDYSRKIFNTNGNDLHSSMYPEYERETFMAYGEYTFDNEGNTTIFFEYLNGERETFSDVGSSQLAPWVAADYEYNVCNPNSPIGFDCGALGGAIYSNPDFIQDSNDRYTKLYGAWTTPYGWYNFCGIPYGSVGMVYNGDPLTAAQQAACDTSPQNGWVYGAVTSNQYWGQDPNAVGPDGNIDSASVYCYFYAYNYGERCSGGGGAIPTQPFVSIVGDRTAVRSVVKQERFVVGASGDITMEINGFNDWTYEVSYTSTESSGLSYRQGVRGDKLAFALGFDPSGPFGTNPTQGTLDGSSLTPLPNGPCDATGSIGEISQEVIDGCVLVNLFAPSVFAGITGEFASAAERDYLFSESVFDTVINQEVISAFATGTILSAPAGDIAMVLGLEKQVLEIDSIPDFIADQGLLVDFTSNGGAKGEQIVEEAFFEFGVPLLAGLRFAQELNLEFSGRHTSTTNKNGYKGTESTDSGKTFSVKMSYRPIDDLLLRATRGTAFRAPNLRETALRDETDTINVYDYCYAPRGAVALDNETGQYTYFRDRDFRDEQTINNCIAAGLDPVNMGHTLFSTNPSRSPNPYSAEYLTGGAVGLNSETSDSITFGLVYDIPYANLFANYDGTQNTTIGITRYELTVMDSIIELSPGYINYQCYVESNQLNSPFCDKITRDATTGDILSVSTGFLNRDEETANGIDFNILHTSTLNIGSNAYDFGIDVTANTIRERNLKYVNDDGVVTLNEYATEPGFPKWNIFTRAFLELGDFRLTWQTNYMSRVDQDPDDVDQWGSAYGFGTINEETGSRELITADTCYGTTKDAEANDTTQVPVGDVLCRDIGFIKSYVTHNTSLYYYKDNLIVGLGVRNVFDREPPMVDPSEIDSKSNAPLGYGYSLNGRSYFLNVQYNF